MNSDTICRICIEKFQNLHETYDIFDGEEPIFTLIMRCTSVQVNPLIIFKTTTDESLPDIKRRRSARQNLSCMPRKFKIGVAIQIAV
jgi:hypothetical protein